MRMALKTHASLRDRHGQPWSRSSPEADAFWNTTITVPRDSKPTFVSHKDRGVRLPTPFHEVTGVKKIDGQFHAVDRLSRPLFQVTETGAIKIQQLLMQEWLTRIIPLIDLGLVPRSVLEP